MKHVVWIALFLAGGAASARAAFPPASTVTLANGLRVVLAPDPAATAVDVAAWYPAAARVEPAGRSGITHVLERLMIRAAGAARDDRRELAGLGALANTYTTPDFTSVFVTGTAAALEPALDFQARRMSQLKVGAPDLETERAFVARERRLLIEGNPVRHAVDLLYSAMFPRHGYGHPATGTSADLARLTADDLNGYYRDHYGPQDAVLTVVGRFDPDAALTAIRSRFESLPKRAAAAVGGAAPPAPAMRVRGRVPGNVPLLLVGWREPAASDSTTLALTLLARALGSGESGRLARVQGASHPYLQARAAFDPGRDGSLFYVLAVLRAAGDSTGAELALVDQVEKLASTPVDAADLERIKREWEMDWLSDQQTVRGRARLLGAAELLDGSPDAHDGWNARVRAFTAADLQAVAQRTLLDRPRTVAILTPQPRPQPPPAAPRAGRRTR